MFKFYQKIIVQQFKGTNRIVPHAWHNGFASSTQAEAKHLNTQNVSEDRKHTNTDMRNTTKRGNKMIQNVFASINIEDSAEDITTPTTDNKLANAKTVDELLAVSEGNGVSRKHALRVVSILSNWTSSRKIELRDFENDPRFVRLCRVLTKSSPPTKSSKVILTPSKGTDLNTVLNITADEEAAKLVGNISLPQMVKVLTTLSIKRRRSILLLRSLAFNIAGSPEKMDIKQCADLFYSLSSLNFYDENVFEKTANNIIEILQKDTIRKSSVVGSILTSVGLLKYKNTALLDAISDWMAQNHSHCRPQDIFSLFMTLAVLNHIPANCDHIFKLLVPQLTQEEAGKPGVWLEIVWSLILLNQANAKHVESVLSDAFIDLLKERKLLNTSAILKLLNIDGAAHYLLENYNGPKIKKDHEIRKTSLQLAKEKLDMVNSVVDTLKNLIPETYFRTRVNTGLGFYIDAECLLDKSCNPLQLDDSTVPDSEKIKVAILALDYHDMCKGRMEVTGIQALCQKLLTAMGYRIVEIPYTDFKATDKIVNKVQYLENKLKQTVKMS
ncbi:unnamed protein product [Ceutorhynchus assimilis]|uniref:RAP domain-containing protein n=1 Tax=Ceutorhynchus assimilis TaxID=467358 RepID=A0A9N9QKP4_9CUCU|nr:unnamed protein product [Ceutorhynchus assimilis]